MVRNTKHEWCENENPRPWPENKILKHEKKKKKKLN